ncbi:MAG: hypothetical protein WD377_02570, partial [Nitriliruptoraceae bacterium]
MHDRHRSVEIDVDAAFAERGERVVGRSATKRAEQPVGGLDEDDAHVVDVEARVVAPQHVIDEFGERSGKLDTRRTSAGDDERQVAVSTPIRPGRGDLEAAQYVVPQRERLGQRLETEGVLGDAGDAEIARHRAGGHHQVVVGHPGAVVELYEACRAIDVDHGAEPDPDVRPAVSPPAQAEDRADRMADILRLQSRR